jgi:hypothetical protein
METNRYVEQANAIRLSGSAIDKYEASLIGVPWNPVRQHGQIA